MFDSWFKELFETIAKLKSPMSSANLAANKELLRRALDAGFEHCLWLVNKYREGDRKNAYTDYDISDDNTHELQQPVPPRDNGRGES